MNVFRLRDRGGRLLPATIRANGPVAGFLGVHERARHDPRKRILLATLCDAEFNYLIYPLDEAWVKRITERGILIAGKEIIPPSRGSGVKGGKYASRQTWWCEFPGAAMPSTNPNPPAAASESRRLAVPVY